MLDATAYKHIEAWGGVECTINRVGDHYRDQLRAVGLDNRPEELARLTNLGLEAVRFPILWERICPHPDQEPDWSWTDRSLAILRNAGLRVIGGLVHHGSGPRHTSLVDPGFAPGLAAHASRAAERYPWIRDWTPVNEPLTTARFAALYGVWYPHLQDERSFWLALLNQVDGVRQSMRAIRAVQPDARLIQTDDLGRTYATPANTEQAAFDNQRRWMTWDLLCGMVGPAHPLWKRLWDFGFGPRLRAILADPCPPDVIGINHYLTSDRLLDERCDNYPPSTRGGNGQRAFCDIEAVRVLDPGPQGLRGAIDEAWQRYRRPIAITEVHNGCTREEQVRWIGEAWATAREAAARGVDIRAVTAWALFGSQGWDTLLTEEGSYEAGAFDISGNTPRETALADAIRAKGAIAASGTGWWRRDIRWSYPSTSCPAPLSARRPPAPTAQPQTVLIVGATGTLGQALARECRQRDLAHVVTRRDEIDLTDSDSIALAIARLAPWAVVNAAGWVRVDDAEEEPDSCHSVNAAGAIALAHACARAGIPSVAFSSDLVFNGAADDAFTEDDPPRPLNVYGASKAAMEQGLGQLPGRHLVARTAAFFSPHDPHNFAVHCLDTLGRGEAFMAVADRTVSPSYVPDLCRAAIDLLIDGEAGLWHLTNGEAVTWFDFACRLALAAGLDPDQVRPIEAARAGWTAQRPISSALVSTRGRPMPSLQSAIDRFAASYKTSQKRPSPEPALSA